jgi:hypothetical protein
MNTLSPLLGLVTLVSGDRLRIVFSSVGRMKYMEFNVQDLHFLL